MDPQIVPEFDSRCDFMVNCVVMVLAQAAAVAKLQLPEWMERLATIFGTLTTVYGFLLRQHIQAGTPPPPRPTPPCVLVPQAHTQGALSAGSAVERPLARALGSLLQASRHAAPSAVCGTPGARQPGCSIYVTEVFEVE